MDSTAENDNEKIVAENELNSALTNLRITIEAYPELKANSTFIKLQDEISNIESKLSIIRMCFNSSTKEYNTTIELFPANIFAVIFHFQKENMFDLGTSERENLQDLINF